MLLIRPDVLEKYQKDASSSSSSSSVAASSSAPVHSELHKERFERPDDEGPQNTYIQRELIKDSLSPIAPTVEVLGHLQKEMARVLTDPTMDTEDKLATYNDLMMRSQILTSKAKAMSTEPYTHDIALHAPGPAAHDRDPEDTQPEKRPIPVREKVKKTPAFIPEPLLKAIDQIPVSYRVAAKKLYLALKTGKGTGISPHFTKSGRMIVGISQASLLVRSSPCALVSTRMDDLTMERKCTTG